MPPVEDKTTPGNEGQGLSGMSQVQVDAQVAGMEEQARYDDAFYKQIAPEKLDQSNLSRGAKLADKVNNVLPEAKAPPQLKGLRGFLFRLYMKRAEARIEKAIEDKEIDPLDKNYIWLKVVDQAVPTSVERDGVEPVFWEGFFKPLGVLTAAFVVKHRVETGNWAWDKNGEKPTKAVVLGTAAATMFTGSLEIIRQWRRLNARLNGAIAGAIASLDNESRNSRKTKQAEGETLIRDNPAHAMTDQEINDRVTKLEEQFAAFSGQEAPQSAKLAPDSPREETDRESEKAEDREEKSITSDTEAGLARHAATYAKKSADNSNWKEKASVSRDRSIPSPMGAKGHGQAVLASAATGSATTER